jgi:hypothetical protein
MWIWSADTPQTSFNGDPNSKLSDLIYGTADKPYVERILLPAFTRTVYIILPESFINNVEETLLSIPKANKEMLRLGWEKDFLAEYLTILLFSFITLLCFPFVMRKLFNHFYETKEELTNIISLGALFCLPFFFPTGPHYIYDFPALLFFTLGVLFLLQKRWIVFYIIFVIGLINKETILFLSAAFVFLYFKKMEKKNILFHLLLQIIIFVVIKSILIYTFAANDGGLLQFSLHRNIHELLYPYSLISFIAAAIIIFLIFYRINEKPADLKRLALLIFPFGIALLLFAYIEEARDLYEIFPIFYLMIMHTVLFTFFKVNTK